MRDEPDLTPEQLARLEADAMRLTRVVLAVIERQESARRPAVSASA